MSKVRQSINQKIYLSNEIIKDNTISDIGIAVYCYFKSVDRTDTSETYINPTAIQYFFTGDWTLTDSQKKKLVAGIKELEEHNLIQIVANKGYDYWCNLTGLYINNRSTDKSDNMIFFSIIELDEIRKIMCITDFEKKNFAASRYKILRYYMIIISTFLKGSKNSIKIDEEKISGIYGITSIDILSDMLVCSTNTILQYNRLLEHEKIIFIYRAKEIILIDGSVKGITNTYGRYRHKQFVENIGIEHKSKYSYSDEVETKKMNAIKCKERKQLANFYNQMFWGKKEYDKETTIKVYKYILERNIKEWNEQKKADLSIFDKYDYVRNIKEQSEKN